MTYEQTWPAMNISNWAIPQSSSILDAFNDPPASQAPFDGSSYTAAHLLQQVNAALAAPGHPPVAASAVWPQAATWMTLDGQGQPTGWLGTTPAEQYAHAMAAWQQAQDYVAQHSALGIRGAQDTVQLTGLDAMSIATQPGAWKALRSIDSALDQVNAARATLGALQTRFEKAIENIEIQQENITAARGRIVDTDFASETANLSRAQILQQAGTAMVAQANQLPQNVLSLLR